MFNLQAIGRPPMPPYWSLGFHICRWGYGDLQKMKKVHERNILAEIPFVSDNKPRCILEKSLAKVHEQEN